VYQEEEANDNKVFKRLELLRLAYGPKDSLECEEDKRHWNDEMIAI
jgi:hypothetical protein